MKALILVILLGLINNFCVAQGNVNITDRRNIYDEKGDYYFEKEEFKKAIAYYNMAYAKDARNYYSILRKAEAYTELELYPQVAECYRIIFESDLRINNIYRLQYAFALLENNNIKEFEKWLSLYNEVIETEIKGKNYISTEENRGKLYKDSTIIIVDRVKELNTPQSEICPVGYEDQIIFASTRSDIAGNTSNNSYNIFLGNYTKNGKFNKIEIFNSALNSGKDEKSVSFFDVNNSMYFSRSTSNNANLSSYVSNIPMDNTEALDISEIKIENFNNIGHVTLNSNGTKIYFVSDAPGGFGGFDIYSSNLVDGKWSAPENLGNTINSDSDEMYPHIFNDTILYFSSNNKNGIGGFDLYKATLSNSNISAQNLGAKVNSEYDDYSLTMSTEGLTGYFSSNRPGGAGKEDIYRLHILDLKVKYAAYKHKLMTSIEDGKINLYVSNGDEYNIASSGNDGFNFGFKPEEDYKMVIQHENTTAENIINNQKLTAEQKEKEFLTPAPIERAEIKLQAGMKYQFTSGLNSISSDYKNELNDLSNQYQDPDISTIDLTALAKELSFNEGEIYTIRFEKDDSRISGYKAKGESQIFVNNEEISIYGRSFFIVLPLDIEVNFNIQTDIAHFKENFNPKKHGVIIDQGSVFTKDNQDWLISMIVNTDSINEVKPANQLTAEEISIVPGTEYILTLGRIDPETGDDVEVIVPLTRGVRYNLGSTEKTKGEYKKALAELVVGREDIELSDEEIIDVSVISKALNIEEGENLKFNLMPAKQFGAKATESRNIKSKLNLDGKVIDLSKQDKYTINVPFNENREVVIQTDIDFILENFNASDISLMLDTIAFFAEITIDTTGFGTRSSADWLSMSVNTDSTEEVEQKNQLVAQEVSIIPGKEYILTVSKTDAETGEETEIIVPLTRKVKYDFTSNPDKFHQESFDKFLESQNDFETTDGEVIDISMLSKELQIKEGDEVSFSLLPAKVFRTDVPKTTGIKSSLILDQKIVEFTQIQKYTINVPLNEEHQVNIQTDIEHLQENFEPGTYILDLDTISFFSEITVDTTGYGDRVVKTEEITDPVFDVIVVNFELNAFSLSIEAQEIIESKVADILKGDSRLYVTIKGYTDGLGNAVHNKQLSGDRAHSVKSFLAKKGIGENRIRTFSFGESQALSEGVNWEDLDEVELRKHRKVEIVIYLPE